MSSIKSNKNKTPEILKHNASFLTYGDNHNFYKSLLNDMITFVAVLDQTGTILFINNTPLKAVGICLDDIQGKKFWDAPWWAYSQDAIDKIRLDVELCAKGEHLTHEIELSIADGTRIWIEYSMHPILDQDGQVEYLVPEGRDVTELHIQRKKLQALAYYDKLTQLPNRTLFATRFSQAIAHSQRTQTLLAICFLDLDNFKPINDSFGHDIGDLLLIEVAKRMNEILQDGDTASRQGGDEFTLLLSNIDTLDQCKKTVARILDILSVPFVINGYSHAMTASCGITLHPLDDVDDMDMLLRHADQAMYQAKSLGKARCVFFNSNMEKEALKHVAFNERIAQAVSNDELVLYYQPKVNMQTGNIYGMEALVRWNHPEKGLIQPLDFLPKIENTQTMIDLGNWVMEQALYQLNIWMQEGKHWKVSINIDAHHFMEKTFYTHLEQVLSNYPNVPNDLLEIEMVETVAFKDLKIVSKRIRHCQALDVSFSLDDFGTGYSSLAYLKDLPVECLKIDQSFVKDMLEQDQYLALVEGVISLAKAFKYEVIAEGVETVSQAAKLLKLGCINAQGYGIAKPMPAHKVIAWEMHYKRKKPWKQYCE